jgi:hypothetical protein
VLVNGATLPEAWQLPSSIQGLSSWQATSVRADPDFRKDMRTLVNAVRSHTIRGIAHPGFSAAAAVFLAGYFIYAAFDRISSGGALTYPTDPIYWGLLLILIGFGCVLWLIALVNVIRLRRWGWLLFLLLSNPLVVMEGFQLLVLTTIKDDTLWTASVHGDQLGLSALMLLAYGSFGPIGNRLTVQG